MFSVYLSSVACLFLSLLLVSSVCASKVHQRKEEIKENYKRQQEDGNVTRHEEIKEQVNESTTRLPDTTEEIKIQQKYASTQRHEETSIKVNYTMQVEGEESTTKHEEITKENKTNQEVDITNFEALKKQMDDYWKQKREEQVRIRLQPPLEAMGNVVALETYMVDQFAKQQN
uniref:Uncharacterized protein n=1 Tax=Cacopsylla melanoneura TaxID=428564 RepID=A0A8D8SZU1_9HEMI